jgi:predicted MPP superfamily phosphohydrolase
VRGEQKLDPNTLARDADFRILLCHYPRVLDRLEPDRFDLVLAGHMHDGQIALPYPGGKLRFAHLSAHYQRGVYRSAAATMHVSPGLGTTFVPFRFAARPEATELVLRSVH